MIEFPNAKINLGLNIIEKRSDGFHNIETVFYPIQLCDGLEINTNNISETKLNVYGIRIDGNTSDNILLKAYSLLANDYNLPPIEIFLQKNIPFGAGLGGGSSDAAFLLKMLNQNFNLQLSTEDICNYASKLGADCAFFIHNKPVFASGKGDVFENINISLKGLYLVLIKPNIGVSTQQAYANCLPTKPQLALKEIIKLPISEWKNALNNDFEYSVFPQYSEIKEIKDKLYESGAIYASMSGSGSSVYGIFHQKPNLPINLSNNFKWEGILE